MFTTGFRFFFGLFVTLTVAAVVYGYSTGGGHVGPISLGWKGGVGDHVGYGVLLALAAVSLAASLLLVSFRDADPDAQAELLGMDAPPREPVVTGSSWPVVAAFGLGAVAVGLVLHPAVFVLGLVMTALSAVEWTMDAWADGATGDSVANRELRNRIMAPIEVPVAGALGVGIVVLAASRILLTVSKLGAVVFAGVVATVILVGAVAYARRPGTVRRLVGGLGVAAALLLLLGGVLATVAGERDFEHHEIKGADESGHDEGSETETEPENAGNGS